MAGGVHVEGTSDGSQGFHCDVFEGTLQDDGTLDGLDGVDVGDGVQVGVVGNDQTTADGGDVGEVDVGQVVVVFNGQVGTDGGDEREFQFFHGGLEETGGLVDALDNRHGDGGDGVEGQVVGPDQVLEFDDGTLTVEGDGQGVGHGLDVGRDGGHVEVVVDVEDLDVGRVDTVEGVELGV